MSYIKNGIRVLKKYLFPSLNAQSCKDFIWILTLGDDANMTYVKSHIEEFEEEDPLEIIKSLW